MTFRRLSLLFCLALTACAQSGDQNGGLANQCDSRQLVLAFYNEALIARQPRTAFGRYAARAFVEHKPDVPKGTREATIDFLEGLIAEMPQARWEVIRTIAENEMVFVHARFVPQKGAPAFAIADVFRTENCLIAEHWDVVAGPSKTAANPNSRF